MTRAIVLGAGMVGSVMAADIAADPAFEVTIADAGVPALARIALAAARAGVDPARIRTVRADLADPAVLRRTIAPFDVVLGALPSAIGFQTLRTVIEAGKNFCDICFMSEDAMQLDELARANGVTAVVDCGVAPGMSNMIAGFASEALSNCSNIEIYVGGLPQERRWPFEYKAAFSPADVIEEYTRPARIVENSRIVVREALSEPELIDLPHVGTLEAFNTDGLRSLAYTLRVPFMKEKTLRYPGHIELMRVLRHLGLFSREQIHVGATTADPGRGVLVRPLDVLSALMFPKWTYEPGEPDLTVMRVIADGEKEGARVRMTYDLFDVLNPVTHFTSMSRTTAFPCTIAARMVASGQFKRPGVNPPEFLGREPGVLSHFLIELARRGVRYESRTEPLNV